MFIRKVAPEFPDEILRHYIYEQNRVKDDELLVIEPIEFTYNRYKIITKNIFYYLFIVIALYILYIFLI